MNEDEFQKPARPWKKRSINGDAPMYTSATAHKHDWRTGERRSCHREPLQWAVLVFFGDNWGKLIDLSERGMSFQFAHAPALNEPITFTFEAMGCGPLSRDRRDFGDAVQATGQVVWAQEFERTAGVQFLELSPRSRDQIRHWMSSAPGQEAAPAGNQPQEELTEEWSREWNNHTSREGQEATPAPFQVEEPVAPFAEAPDEPLSEISEGELENLDSQARANWEPGPTFEPPSLDPDTSHAQSPQEPEYGFEPRPLDQQADDMERPGRARSAFARLGASAPETEGLWEPNPESAAQDNLADDRRGLWEPKPAPEVQEAGSFGFDLPPGFLEHEERQRRGQTLVLRQRRTRVGSLAVLSFLTSVGAVAGIIAFISKFSERPEVAASTSHPSAGQAEGGLTESTTPFLVEVLDANHRRSVLWFSSEVRKNTAAHTAESSAIPATLASDKQASQEESEPPVTKQSGPSHDFSLGAPHASDPATNATKDSTQSSTALVEPALSGDLPVPADVPLQTALSSPGIPAPVEQALQPGGAVQPARLIRAAAPVYPRLAKSLRVSGDVTLDALIDESGNVRDVKVLDGDVLLREAAKQALRQWKYEPARLDGRPTAMHLTVTLKFHNDQGGH